MNAPLPFTDLVAELEAAVDLVTEVDVDHLEAAGVPRDVLFSEPPLVGTSQVETRLGGLFEFADTPGATSRPTAIVVGCYTGGWVLEDLAAFYLSNPQRWWRYRGSATMLGEHNIGAFRVDPTRIEDTPLDWLIGSGRGLCVLDWKLDPLDTLMGAGALSAEAPIYQRLRKRTVACALSQLGSYLHAG